MPKMISTTAIALVIAMGASSVSAQNLRSSDGPAEIPPASFSGKQYVDSKGCVFVRAGFAGAVNWVPRVNRKRKVLCGFSPTLAKATPAPKPVATPPPRVVAAPVATVPKPTQVEVVSAPPKRIPAPKRVVPVPPRAVVQPLKRVPPVVVAKPRPVQVAPAPTRVVTTATGCPGASPLSQKYLVSTRNVRCGPQGNHPSSYGNVVPNGVATGVPTNVIRVDPAPEIRPPSGYKAAFEEDRFNPNRGLQTREGHAQMRLVWTSGVPRRLIDQNTRRDVTSLFPGLRFPFISLKQQTRYVAVNGWPAQSGVKPAPTVTYSTKNTKPTQVIAPAPVAGGHRFVQVGTFSVRSNAQASAARLQQLGLPARMGNYSKNGKTYTVVLAGPFGNPSQLGSALNKARRAGFSDAFTRK